MIRPLLISLIALVTLCGQAGAQYASNSPYGKPERRDPIFLRFPEMAQRYWVNTETMAASHKSVAVPMPRQCAFVYADSYTRGQMSEREVQDTALSTCNRKLAELGPLGENYNINCQCKVVISDDKYVVPRDSMPEQAYGPASIFYRDGQGNIARLNGSARYGALIGHDRSVTFSIDNVNAEPVCEGTFTNEAPNSGRFSLSCFNGKFGGNGNYESRTGAPNDHIVARGQNRNGQPIVMVIGLPAQLATNTYGGI
ncbi:hypothetical protein SAMN02745126_01275 [Enhydrobacter aerosaccus]|uniref:DUF4189 domain-containing protein n=1 Tax=Enhydrobacter aerosaccus TaxID=225324 RepID=A0A1T4L0I3_9HYPH|nr:hypothetical protein [Enhydrobacter aerosaccus]SJZ48108.1 hypothetical protein SAMN02745126_01275 [Enhydrobacter aerosaccus]